MSPQEEDAFREYWSLTSRSFDAKTYDVTVSDIKWRGGGTNLPTEYSTVVGAYHAPEATQLALDELQEKHKGSTFERGMVRAKPREEDSASN